MKLINRQYPLTRTRRIPARVNGFRLSRWVLPALLFLPSFVMVGLMQSSMAAGMILCVAGLSLHFPIHRTWRTLRWSRQVIGRSAMLWLMLSAGILIHAVVRMTSSDDLAMGRFLSGYIVFVWVALVAMVFSLVLSRVPALLFSRRVDAVMAFLVVNALIGLTGIGLLPGGTHKPVGIFAEPSHFALVLGPVMAYACVARRRWAIQFLVFFFLWGIFVQNLTVLLTCVLCLLLIIRFDWRMMILPVLAVLAVSLAEPDYFVSRLVISADSENQSVLVLLQGWETAGLLLDQTRGWGAGFQQFGVLDMVGDVGEKLDILSEEGINKLDGGSTAAKIVGEFGYFGALGVLLYLVAFVLAFVWLRNIARSGAEGGGVFLVCSGFMFFVEMFARGVGYFSPTFFLCLSATFWWMASRRAGVFPVRRQGTDASVRIRITGSR